MFVLSERHRYNRFVLAMCGLAGLLYGIDVGLIAAALPYIKATCGYSPAELSSIVAAVLLGAILGSFVAAPLYMAECAPPENRGKGTGMIQLVLTVGRLLHARGRGGPLLPRRGVRAARDEGEDAGGN